VPNDPELILYDVPTTARVLSIGKDAVYELVASGELPSVRISERTIRIPRHLLEKWIESRATGGRA
jgi:excisionase family DNA binding protein